MSCSLLRYGRKEPCKDALGGVRKVYISPFVFYNRAEMVFDRDITLESIPPSTVFEFEIRGTENTYSQSFDGEAYIQTVNLTLHKQDYATSEQMMSLFNIDHRVILLMNDGTYRVFGVDNGLSVDSLNITSGGARQEFNGYKAVFSGKERFTAPYVDNLEGAGFTIVTVTDFYQFQDLEFFQFQDGAKYEFQD